MDLIEKIDLTKKIKKEYEEIKSVLDPFLSSERNYSFHREMYRFYQAKLQKIYYKIVEEELDENLKKEILELLKKISAKLSSDLTF